jgi:NDP-sugar pyrophosphorylase family protein
MRAVILVGGRGTRLQPLTFSIPKPLLPVGEKPILQLIIEQLRTAGFQELILATGYHAELIQAFCGDGAKFGLRISYVKENRHLGTAGPLCFVRDRFGENEFFLVMNGDILTRLNFKRFLEVCRKADRDLAVGYVHYEHRSPFGVLSIIDGQVTGVREKPSQEYPISTGIYCVKGTALRFVPQDTFFTMPELIQQLLDAGRSVGAYHIQECWMGLETIQHFEEAIKELKNAPAIPVPRRSARRTATGADLSPHEVARIRKRG